MKRVTGKKIAETVGFLLLRASLFIVLAFLLVVLIDIGRKGGASSPGSS